MLRDSLCDITQLHVHPLRSSLQHLERFVVVGTRARHENPLALPITSRVSAFCSRLSSRRAADMATGPCSDPTAAPRDVPSRRTATGGRRTARVGRWVEIALLSHRFGTRGSRYNVAQEVVGLDERRHCALVVGAQLGKPAKYMLNVHGLLIVSALRGHHRVLRAGETPGGSPR